ncbi:alpha/beta hydrolase [Williamsia herbipolensis]|uniref:Alpha/beta hydrolase n=1 Tax=Williamsia herbipolensis TaxID=1603258 RepID=A0AAU4JYV7_9NOCA|nr:alpha/beta hydrolase [Williamsia herbipolensis]
MPTEIEYTRVEETFASEGVTCAATVYRPSTASPESRKPVIVMGHGFGGVRALRLPAYAEVFAAAGYVVMLFDYRYFGDSEGEPRQLLDVPSQLADWRSAIAFARTIDVADPDAVVAWGTSFAGGHVITTAGSGERLAAIIAQVPHVSGPAAVRATGIRRALRIAPAAVADTVAAVLHRAPRYVASIGPEGSAAVMTAPGAEEAFERLVIESGLRRGDHPETVAARIALRIGLYSPARSASRVRCPALIQVAEGDTIAPAAAATRAARAIPDATVLTYDGGHFDPYVEPLFPSVVTDQLAFLRTVAPAE